MILHRTLLSLLKKIGLSEKSPPDPYQWMTLLYQVSDLLRMGDEEKHRLKGSLDVHNREVQSLYRELVKERERLSSALACLTVGFIIFDRDGALNLMNADAEIALGWSEEDAQTCKLSTILDLPDEGAVQEMLCSGQFLDVLGYLRHRNGVAIETRYQLQSMFQDGYLTGAVLTFELPTATTPGDSFGFGEVPPSMGVASEEAPMWPAQEPGELAPIASAGLLSADSREMSHPADEPSQAPTVEVMPGDEPPNHVAPSAPLAEVRPSNELAPPSLTPPLEGEPSPTALEKPPALHAPAPAVGPSDEASKPPIDETLALEPAPAAPAKEPIARSSPPTAAEAPPLPLEPAYRVAPPPPVAAELLIEDPRSDANEARPPADEQPDWFEPYVPPEPVAQPSPQPVAEAPAPLRVIPRPPSWLERPRESGEAAPEPIVAEPPPTPRVESPAPSPAIMEAPPAPVHELPPPPVPEVVVPPAPVSVAPPRKPERGAESPMRILLVEDEPVSQLVTQSYLEKLGHLVAIAEDANEAIRFFNRVHFDAVISSYFMPGLNGVELCQKIRESPTGARCYFILLTAVERKEEAAPALEAGVDAFLTKPFDPRELDLRLMSARALQTRMNRIQGQI